MNKQWTIYCHIHVDSGRRYIGLTKNKWQHRWNQHCSKFVHQKNRYNHFYNAIRKYGPEAFSHEILEVCDSLELANVAEESWIDHFQTRDPEKGFNLARGGDHTPHPIKNPWDRPGFREKNLEYFRNYSQNSKFKEKRSRAAKRMWEDSSYREKVTSSSRASRPTPAAKLKQSLIQKEIKSRPEVREKQIEASIRIWESEEYRLKNAKLWENGEFRDRCQTGLKHGSNLNKSKTHCRNGHEYSIENTYLNIKGSRDCRTCLRLSKKLSYRKCKLKKKNLLNNQVYSE